MQCRKWSRAGGRGDSTCRPGHKQGARPPFPDQTPVSSSSDSTAAGVRSGMPAGVQTSGAL